MDRATRIPVPLFTAALHLSGLDDVSETEAECYIANMIYKGMVRGYISHERQTVVLASTNAFPSLADRPKPYVV
jgi:COP9 signalosome complex subunit 12